MMLYNPVDGDVSNNPIRWRVRTCFLMRQLGKPIPPTLEEVVHNLSLLLTEHKLKQIDADSLTTSKDFLLKIWHLVISVPIGIALIHKGIAPRTMSNIFYEVGWMQALGKETLIIKIGDISIPSDFARTEYVSYDEDFNKHIHAFVVSLQESVDHYINIADQVERNPLLAIDYLRRAYLLTGKESIKRKARTILESAGLSERAKNSVEMLSASFIYSR